MMSACFAEALSEGVFLVQSGEGLRAAAGGG